MGYYRAGFDVVGIDSEPQPRYPFHFLQADALTPPLDLGVFDVIHASPPCQAHSVTKHIHKRNHPDMIEPTRELLVRSGKPYVIENVIGAPLLVSLMLCGSMFPGLRVYRHRVFECNPVLYFPPASCNHTFSMPPSKGVYHRLEKQKFITCVGHNFQASSGKVALGIDWMTRDEMSQSIPPAYTEYIGRQLIAAMEQKALPEAKEIA